MTSTLESRTRSTPGTRATSRISSPELETLLRIAVVADADPGHHHLRLPRGDPPPRLSQDRAGGPRAGGAADGRDDAVRAVAVTAVLDLDETPGAHAGLEPARGKRIALEVRTCHARELARDIVGSADKRLHTGVEIGELTRVQVGGAPGHVDALRSLQRAPGRLARLRLRLAGDAARVDQVQLGLSLGRLRVSGREQGLPGEHRVRLGHLAAEELDRERGHAPGR